MALLELDKTIKDYAYKKQTSVDSGAVAQWLHYSVGSAEGDSCRSSKRHSHSG